MRNRLDTRGFTIAEILVALAITALLMMTILGVLVNVLDSASRSEKRNAAQKVGHAIINLVQRDLEAAYLPANAKASGNERAYFQVVDGGLYDSMDFITVVQSMPNEDNKRSPISEIGYRMVDNTEAGEGDLFILYRREDVYEDDAEPLAGGRFIEIYDRATKFNITCYDGVEWHDSWDWVERDKKMPMAVKVELEIAVDKQAAAEYLSDAEIERIQRQSVFTTIISLPLGEKAEETSPGR